jgi:hypothetical protein
VYALEAKVAEARLGRHVVSSNSPRRALHKPDRSAPRLGLRFAVGSRTPHVRLKLS